MPDSPVSRLWNSVKPPEAAHRVESITTLELRRRQRRLIAITLAILVVIGAGIWVANYILTAPQRADREFQAGMSSMHPGKYADAIAHFSRALSISPQLPKAYLERANAHRSLGENDAALADFQTAAELDGSLVDAHTGIAMGYIARKDNRHALEEFSKSIALRPTTDAYYQRGQLYEALGEHRTAIDDYDKAIAQQRDSPYIYNARALAKQNLGDEEGAKADRKIAAHILAGYVPLR